MAQEVSVEAIAGCLLINSPDNRMRLQKHLEDIIANSNEYVASNVALLRVLRNLSDKEIMDKYWDKVVKEIKADHSNSSMSKSCLDTAIMNYCSHPLGLGGSYRHYGIEKVLREIIIKDLRDGMSNIIPSKFARYASFIVGYSKPTPNDDDIPNFIVGKMEKMAQQFNVRGTIQLSKGVSIYSYLKNR